MVTKQDLIVNAQQVFAKQAIPELNSMVRGVDSGVWEQLLSSEEYNELQQMLAQDILTLLGKHGLATTTGPAVTTVATTTGPAVTTVAPIVPQVVSPSAQVTPAPWTTVTMRYLQLASSKSGLPNSAIEAEQQKHLQASEAIWDVLSQRGVEEARSKGTSEANLESYQNDPLLGQLRENFTSAIVALAIAKKYGS